MRRVLFAILFGMAVTVFEGSVWALDIVKDGHPVAVIVTPDRPDPIVMDAANCLNEYVEKIAGVRLRVIPESEAGSVADNIVALGNTEMARRSGINVDGIPFDGYIQKVAGKILFIAGPDEDLSARIADSDNAELHRIHEWANDPKRFLGLMCRRGTLHGVIWFLHDYCGVRWFIPTPMGERVPRSADIHVPDDLSVRYDPPFVAYANNGTDADGWGLWAYRPGFYWAMANGFRLPISFLHMGGHSWVVQVRIFAGTAEELFKVHPEYFALRNGKRELGNPLDPMLCTSNPEVVEMLTQTMQRMFDQGFDMVPYNQSDGYQRCECAQCEAMDEYRGYEDGKFTRPCERLFIPLKEIAERCYKSHPDKKIVASVYGPTRRPSEKIREFPPNVIWQLSHTTPADFELWKGRGDLFATWLYWFGAYLAPGITAKYTPQAAAENIARFHSNGIRLLYWGLGASGEDWGNEGPVFYVIGQMIHDPSQDYRRILKEYYAGVYGDAADDMEKYFDYLYERISSEFLARVGTNMENYDAIVTSEEFFTRTYPPEVLDKLEALLEAAKAHLNDERSRGWYALTVDQFRYIQTTANVIHAYHAFQKDPSRENLLRVKACVGERNRHLDTFMGYRKDKAFLKNWYPGYYGLLQHAQLVCGNKRRQLGAPFTWDFNKDPDVLLREAQSEKKEIQERTREIE